MSIAAPLTISAAAAGGSSGGDARCWGWLEALNRIDPLTYGVDPMRHLVFAHIDASAAARRTLDPGITWWGRHLPPLLEAAVVLALGVAMMAIAIRRFSRTE